MLMKTHGARFTTLKAEWERRQAGAPRPAPPRPRPTERDRKLTPAQRQGCWVTDTGYNPGTVKTIREQVELDPYPRDPDTDVRPPPGCTTPFFQVGIRETAGTPPALTDWSFGYGPDGRCCARLASATLCRLRADWTRVRAAQPALHAAHTLGSFPADVIAAVARHRPPARSRSRQNGLAVHEAAAWTLDHPLALALTSALGLVTERFASPFDRTALSRYWSAHPADCLFGAHHDALSAVWAYGSFAHPPAGDAKLLNRAVRHAITSARHCQTRGTPSCTVFLVPDRAAGYSEYTAHPFWRALGTIPSGAAAFLGPSTHHGAPDLVIPRSTRTEEFTLFAITNPLGEAAHLAPGRIAALRAAWATARGPPIFGRLGTQATGPRQQPPADVRDPPPPRALRLLLDAAQATGRAHPRGASPDMGLPGDAAGPPSAAHLAALALDMPPTNLLDVDKEACLCYTDGSVKPAPPTERPAKRPRGGGTATETPQPGLPAQGGLTGEEAIGAGVVVTNLPGGPPGTRTLYVRPGGEGCTRDVNRAELAALHAALKEFAGHAGKLVIFTDSACSIRWIARQMNAPSSLQECKHRALIQSIVAHIAERALPTEDWAGFRTCIYKVRAHTGVAGNELADQAASDACTKAEDACHYVETSEARPRDKGAWPHLKPDPTPAPPSGRAPRARNYALQNLNAAVKSAAKDRGATRNFSSPRGVYDCLWSSTLPALDAGCSLAWWTNSSVTWGARKQTFKAMWGQLWSAKLACRYKRPLRRGRAMQTAPLCPLCGGTDGTTHILGGCGHPRMEAHRTARHNDAGRALLRTLLAAPAPAPPYVVADLSAADDLPPGVSGTRLPAWLLPSLSNEVRKKLRPDILILDGTFGPDNPGPGTARLVEVGFCSDLNHTEKRAEKTGQHAQLVTAMELAGWTVTCTVATIGHCGTFQRALANDLVRDHGVTVHNARACLRSISATAAQRLHAIVTCRRELEAGIG